MLRSAGAALGRRSEEYRGARARGDMDAATFRKLGHELVDWVADYRERLEQLPVMSPARPGEIRARFPKQPPLAGGRLATPRSWRTWRPPGSASRA